MSDAASDDEKEAEELSGADDTRLNQTGTVSGLDDSEGERAGEDGEGDGASDAGLGEGEGEGGFGEPTLPRKTMADFPGMTIATPRIPIFPSVPIPSLYGTSSKLVPGRSSDDIMESVQRDYENSTYRTDFIYTHNPSSTTPTAGRESATSRDKDNSGADAAPIRVLAATTIPSFLSVPKVPIPEMTQRINTSHGSVTGVVSDTSNSVPSPFATTLSAMTTRVYQSGLATPLSSTTSTEIVGPQVERSLSIHTPTFKGVTPEQLMSSYVQDLATPPQIIDSSKFICWIDFVSTWSYEERQKREDKLSIARFANLGYYIPEIDMEEDFNQRVYLVQGDITAIACDAIINVTDESLSVRSIPSQAIIARGGPRLRNALKQLKLSIGESRVTKPYGLPSRAVIHVAAPTTEEPGQLKGAIETALSTAVDKGFRTICIPSFAPEAYPRPSSTPTYPLVPAAHVMMRTVRKWMSDHKDDLLLDQIIFVASCPREFNVFCELMLDYFPLLPTKPPSPPPPPPEITPPSKPSTAKKKKKSAKKKKK